jgi:hypothetical protein
MLSPAGSQILPIAIANELHPSMQLQMICINAVLQMRRSLAICGE